MSELITAQPKQDLLTVAENIKGISASTRLSYCYAIKSYQKYISQNKLQQNIESLTAWVNSSGTPKTANARLQALSHIIELQYKGTPFYQAVKDELSNIRPKKISNAVREHQYLTKEEIEKTVKSAPLKFQVIIETLFSTGLRISELCNMKHTDGKPLKKIYYAFEFIGKGSKQGTVFIKKKTLDRIKKIFNGKIYLFEHTDKHGNNKPYRREYLTRVISELTERATGKRMSAHKLRHSFACYLRDVLKLDMKKIQQAMRHSNVSTTVDVYLHNEPTPDELDVGM